MNKTHFGFESVDEDQKAQRVRGVFDSVAPKYDLMNDVMSGGLHRAWKAYTLMVANLKPGQRALDIAGGTGDLALAFAGQVGVGGQVVHTDINYAMLSTGRNRLLDAGVVLPTDTKPRRRFRTGVLQVAPETPVAAASADTKPRRRFRTGVLQVAPETPQAPATKPIKRRL